MSSERLSKKQKDILRTLVFVKKRLEQDVKNYNPKIKAYNQNKKRELKEELKKCMKSGRIQIELLILFLKVKNKNNFYKTLRNLEEKGLIKIKRDKNNKFILDICITKKGKDKIS